MKDQRATIVKFLILLSSLSALSLYECGMRENNVEQLLFSSSEAYLSPVEKNLKIDATKRENKLTISDNNERNNDAEAVNRILHAKADDKYHDRLKNVLDDIKSSNDIDGIADSLSAHEDKGQKRKRAARDNLQTSFVTSSSGMKNGNIETDENEDEITMAKNTTVYAIDKVIETHTLAVPKNNIVEFGALSENPRERLNSETTLKLKKMTAKNELEDTFNLSGENNEHYQIIPTDDKNLDRINNVLCNPQKSVEILPKNNVITTEVQVSHSSNGQRRRTTLNIKTSHIVTNGQVDYYTSFKQFGPRIENQKITVGKEDTSKNMKIATRSQQNNATQKEQQERLSANIRNYKYNKRSVDGEGGGKLKCHNQKNHSDTFQGVLTEYSTCWGTACYIMGQKKSGTWIHTLDCADVGVCDRLRDEGNLEFIAYCIECYENLCNSKWGVLPNRGFSTPTSVTLTLFSVLVARLFL